MVKVFGDSESCAAALHDQLARIGAAEIDPLTLSTLVAACEEMQRGSLPAQSFGFQVRRWIIRDSDLDLFGVAKDAALALASSRFIIGDLSVAAVTAIALAVLRVGIAAFRAGASISRRQVQVLSAMKTFSEPIDVETLMSYLDYVDATHWTSIAVVEQELHELTGLSSRKGLVAVVAKTPDGRWVVTDV